MKLFEELQEELLVCKNFFKKKLGRNPLGYSEKDFWMNPGIHGEFQKVYLKKSGKNLWQESLEHFLEGVLQLLKES